MPLGVFEGDQRMFLQKFLKAVAFSAMLVSALTASRAEARSVSISNNSGGTIARYMLHTADYRSAGTLVRFTGRCDSACTLFLSLPSSQTCVSSGAYFRFHAAYGVSSRSQRGAEAYLMQQYPGWVRAWLNRNGGFSRRLITMDYTYARQFMRSCDV